MSKKTTKYTQEGIKKLPNDKPALYRIKTPSGNINYAGVAKKGRVRERLVEHLEEIPGAKVEIEQFSSIQEAREKEERVIKRNQPKYNDQGQ